MRCFSSAGQLFCLHMAEELLIECSAFLDIAIDDEVYSCTEKFQIRSRKKYGTSHCARKNFFLLLNCASTWRKNFWLNVLHFWTPAIDDQVYSCPVESSKQKQFLSSFSSHYARKEYFCPNYASPWWKNFWLNDLHFGHYNWWSSLFCPEKSSNQKRICLFLLFTLLRRKFNF